MAYTHNEGQGSLFKNEKTNERQPDYRGSIVIGGVTYNIAAWNKQSKKGRDYISLSAEKADENAGAGSGSYGAGSGSYGAGAQGGGYGAGSGSYGAPASAPAYEAPLPASAPIDDNEKDDLPF